MNNPNEKRRYQNPIIPGFHPDPSICRVGEDYFLVTSSFEYFPGVPIFHSRDLIHWEQIGYCLTRISQLPLHQAHPSAGIFAPTIRYHQGRFFMITTNVTIHKHLLVWTEDPAGSWSEPLYLEQGYIDPSLFFDEDGTVYFTTNGPNGIWQSILDIDCGKIVSEPRLIWSGTGGQYPEGPHLYRIGDWYYLMIAEGGTEYGHMETIARSRSPWGPFESCPRNPILSNRSLRRNLQCTGHADLFQDHLGSWWVVFLATRPVGYPYAHHLGRETCLAPVEWDQEGWPIVNHDGSVDIDMEGPLPPESPHPEDPSIDHFDQETLHIKWNFLRNPYPHTWTLTERKGWLRLYGSSVTLNDEDSPTWVGRRQCHFSCTIQTLLDFSPLNENEEAGLTIYMNPRHHYEIAKKGGQIILRQTIGPLSQIVAQSTAPQGPLNLKIVAEPQKYTFFVNNEILGTGEPRFLATEVAGGFTGVFFAMYATGNGKPTSSPADFDYFEYQPH